MSSDNTTSTTEPGVSIRARGSWIEAMWTSAGIASLAGMITGVAWGGVGGRVAMRVLFLSSDERVRGVTSDDGFEIGTISGATVFLLIFTAILGGIAGFVYGLLRMVIAGPTWAVAIGVGIAAGAAAGASIVHRDGIDFRLLGPLWLAVALFVVIPGVWGITVVLLTQRLMRPGIVFPSLPERINEQRWGVLGWLVLAAVAAVGVIDLVRDFAWLS